MGIYTDINDCFYDLDDGDYQFQSTNQSILEELEELQKGGSDKFNEDEYDDESSSDESDDDNEESDSEKELHF